MCGIVGYVGFRPALPVLLDGLERLEYRGYDSSGVAVFGRTGLEVTKTAGRLSQLAEKLAEEGATAGDITPAAGGTGGRGKVDAALATIGIGHTRWATHGPPTDQNAHPHTGCDSQFAVVHNGIIENHAELRAELAARGHVFHSETDTEVIPHLLEEEYRGDLAAAVRAVAARLRGSFALAVLAADDPGTVVAVRKESPLVVGLGQGENILASDIPALLPYTRQVIILRDGETVTLRRDGVTVTDLQGRPIGRPPTEVPWDPQQASKAGFDHFMAKEIHEQPRALRDTLAGRISAGGTAELNEIRLLPAEVARVPKVFAVACGTAANAGQVGRVLIEKLAGIPVEVDIASEFRYRDPIVPEGSLCVVISQSGETADTLAGLKEARRRGARIVAITNVMGSSVAREADDVLYTWAGPEIAVASTKAYTTQVMLLSLLAVWLGQARGTLPDEEARRVVSAVRALPQQVEMVLSQEAEVARIAARLAEHVDVFFIGRGIDYAVAVEGQLKLKEISYIHAEAYPAGELKHGTLALITDGVPVIALVTQPDLREKMLSNIAEVKARGAWVVGVAQQGDDEVAAHVDDVIWIPRTHPLLTAVPAVVPLQLLAYHAAVRRGCDVDKPRNLAKSVTVE